MGSGRGEVSISNGVVSVRGCNEHLRVLGCWSEERELKVKGRKCRMRDYHRWMTGADRMKRGKAKRRGGDVIEWRCGFREENGLVMKRKMYQMRTYERRTTEG